MDHGHYHPGRWTVRYLVAATTLVLVLALVQLWMTGSL